MGSTASLVQNQRPYLYPSEARINGKNMQTMIRKILPKYDERFSMKEMDENDKLFKNFPFCLEANDFTFQLSNRTSGSMQEGAVYFPGKHKLYSFKVEVGVRPNGFASDFNKYYPGSTSDLNIFTIFFKFTSVFFRNGTSRTIWKTNFSCLKSIKIAEVLMEKVYQRAADVLRAVTQSKKPFRGYIPRDDEENNGKLLSDLILVENYFGH